MEEVFHPRNIGAAFIDIIKVIFVVSFIAHLFCCSFYFLTTVEDATESWVTKLNINTSDWLGLYVSGMYFAVITMITLGYGDIVPITTKERTFVIGMTLVSCAVFAYSVNTSRFFMNKILEFFFGHFNLIYQSFWDNWRYVIKKKIIQIEDDEFKFAYLKERIKQVTCNEKEMISNESAEKDLDQIPLSLKEDVYQDIYGKLLRSNKVFNLNFTSFFLDKLALKMKEKRFGPEEVIYKQGDEGNTLYFLVKGTVQLFFPIKNPSDTDFLQISKLEVIMKML